MKTAVLAALASFAFAVSVCAADDAPRYTKSALDLSGRLLDVASDDMNGDGLKDVVAVSLKGDRPANARRMVEIFYQKKSGGFAGSPDESWQMAGSGAVFDTGDVAGGGRRAVLYTAPDGMYAYLPEGSGYSRKPSRLIKSGTVFTSRDPMDMPHLDFYDEYAPGRAMALLPVMGSLAVYERTGQSFQLVGQPGLPVQTSFSGGRVTGADSSLTISHRLPVFAVTGYNRPDSPDIVMNWDDNALVFMKGGDGRYRQNPDASFRPGLLSKAGNDPMEGAWLYPVDINGDGRMDTVVTKKTGGIAHTRSLVFIYLRAAGGTFPAKPSKTIITEGVVGPRFDDLNGDGRVDILIPSIKVGVSNFVNMLTSGRVNVDVDIYLQDKSGGFPDRPTKTKSVGFKLDLSNFTKAAPVLETGRFTKGGGYGLAVVSGDKTVSVFLPDRYSVLSDRPGMELSVDAPTEMGLEDLNGDGADDFIMTYKKTDKLSGGINVFVSSYR